MSPWPRQPLAVARQVGCKGSKFSEICPVNAPLRSDADPRLEDFPYRLSDNVRFADLDPNHHVNNAVYATYFETGRVTLMKDRSYGLMPDGVTWIMVRLDMHFRAELRWPGTIELGLGVVKFGFDELGLIGDWVIVVVKATVGTCGQGRTPGSKRIGTERHRPPVVHPG